MVAAVLWCTGLRAEYYLYCQLVNIKTPRYYKYKALLMSFFHLPIITQTVLKWLFYL